MSTGVDTTLLRHAADALVELGAYVQGICDRTDLTDEDVWKACDDAAESIDGVLRVLAPVHRMAFHADVERAVNANLLKMSGRDAAVARAVWGVVDSGCEV